MSIPAIIVWFRRDLRLADNPALSAAVESGAPVVPVYIVETDDDPWATGAAGRWWLHHSLASLGAAVARRGAGLVLARGGAVEAMTALVRQTGAGAVFYNRRFDAHGRARDRAVEAALVPLGVETRSFNAAVLFEPGAVLNGAGKPFQVFTPFWSSCLQHPPPSPPLPAPARLVAPEPAPTGVALEALGLLASPPGDDRPSSIDHDGGVRGRPGETAALEQVAAFLDQRLGRYAATRDRLDLDGTSRLSAALAWGEIGPRQLWHAVKMKDAVSEEAFLRELGWREFSYQLLATFPTMPEAPLRPQFADFPWIADDALFAAWTEGRTGYPIVDAGMRCLRRTGWLHNRLRMIVASFLVKDLLIPWQHGEAWFWDTLVDADLANNAASWQWVAGCGVDAAPYFRIFNPVRQGEKFDPRGHFLRQWLPELAALPDLSIHQPWTAAPAVLAAASVRVGETYPAPVVDHGAARRRALGAYEQMRGAVAEYTPSP